MTIIWSGVGFLFVCFLLTKIYPSCEYFTWAFNSCPGMKEKNRSENHISIQIGALISESRARAKAEAQEGELPCSYANTEQRAWCSLFQG